jgi:hypothetical protein
MPADDASHFAHVAFGITAPPRLTTLPVRTLFTTENRYDAGVAGFDGPAEPGCDGGFSIMFDGRSVPSVELVLSDNQIAGLAAIREARKALQVAEAMAERMEGVS